MTSGPAGAVTVERVPSGTDRKSTRLNYSHRCISHAVFCLKKSTLVEANPPTRFGGIKRNNLAVRSAQESALHDFRVCVGSHDHSLCFVVVGEGTTIPPSLRRGFRG